MTSAMQKLPQGSSFGLEFNYAVWTPGTSISLSNVPWNSDYRDIVHFDTQNALDAYLSARENPTFTFSNLTYAKPGSPVRVNLPFNACYRFNYLRATNPAQPVPGDDSPRTFYYFVTDVRYIAPNTTELQVQLDVWQTFSRNVTMGNCFIERGHVGIANQNQFDDHGRTYLTVPEGLDVGNEYVIAQSYEHVIASNALDTVDGTANAYGIIVASTVGLKPPYGDVTNPTLKSANGSNFEFLPNGCELYYFKSPAAFMTFMLMMADTPWISQGIISITAVPQITDPAILSDPFVFEPEPTDGSGTAYALHGHRLPEEIITLATNFRNGVNLGRYANLKKFLTAPYTIVELTTFSGNPIVLKPECIPNDDLSAIKLMHLAPPSPRVVIAPLGYNMPKGYDASNHYLGEFLDMATGIFDLPSFSIVNNGYLSFMASNRNGIAYQHSSADWSQQRALTGNQLAADQASAGMGLQSSLNTIQNQQILAQTAQANQTQMYRSLQSGANSALSGVAQAASGNVAGGLMAGVTGAANAAVDYGISTNQNNASAGITVGGNNARVDATRGNMGYMRDSNKQYSDFAAKGDYQNAIGAINAKVQDAKMVQPTTAGQIGGDAFNLAAFKWGLFGRLKTLQPAAMALIGEFWLRYGYAVNRFGRMPSDFQVMETFTYWKLRETYITSSTCPESFRQTIRGIFEKGVTVWSDPSKIGNVDMADNNPKSGVTL